jgi:predicted acyl esterase
MSQKKRTSVVLGCLAAVLLSPLKIRAQQAPAKQPLPQSTASKPIFHWQQVMIPMRDGVRLQTVILTPAWSPTQR